MPIFEFECERGHRTEVIDISANKSRLTTVPCSECGETAERIISATNWQWGDGPKESNISRAIGRVRKAEREGKL